MATLDPRSIVVLAMCCGTLLRLPAQDRIAALKHQRF